MRFSVIIPTYNSKALLKNTLEALNYQTGYTARDYEVVVVDDGSSDYTEEYIEGVNRNYNLKYYYLARSAASCRSRTRNCGWKIATGRIVVFIDADILVQPDYLAELDRCFALSEDLLLLGNRIMLDQKVEYQDIVNGNVFKKYRFNKDHYHLLEFRHFLYNVASFNAKTLMCPWIQSYSCNLAVPKKYLEVTGGFDENFKDWGVEDIEIGYSLCKAGAEVVINSKLEVLHQYHGPRNDLIIEKQKVAGYEKNIDYFMTKHPEALKMASRIAYKFLKGEVSSSKMLMELPIRKVEIEFRDPRRLDEVKAELLKLVECEGIKPILYDYVEATDLDIWIQLLTKKKNVIYYYPMSKWVDVPKMRAFIDNEKKLQKIRNESEIIAV
ncbi:MAG: glycosyltransferase family A protein [Bacillota bacterium]|jgi:glycosyltransferase involved in cell wall biosynthesis